MRTITQSPAGSNKNHWAEECDPNRTDFHPLLPMVVGLVDVGIVIAAAAVALALAWERSLLGLPPNSSSVLLSVRWPYG